MNNALMNYGLACACISLILAVLTALLDAKKRYRLAIRTGLTAVAMGLVGVVTSIINIIGG